MKVIRKFKETKKYIFGKQPSIPKRNTGAQLPFNETYYLIVRWNDMRTLGKCNHILHVFLPP